MKLIGKIAAFCVLSAFFLLAGCASTGGARVPDGVVWDWDYARDGWNFGGNLNNLPGVGDGSTTGLAGGRSAVVNDILVFARARPVVENKQYGGLQLGGKGTNSVARLMIGGKFSGDTIPWQEGENIYYDDELPQFDFSRPVRITITFSHYVHHTNRALLIVRVNNNTGTNANSPLGASSIGQVNGSSNFTGRTIDKLPLNEDGKPFYVIEYHPSRWLADGTGKSTLKNSHISLQTQAPGNADGAGPDTENYVVISSIKIEYDGNIKRHRH